MTQVLVIMLLIFVFLSVILIIKIKNAAVRLTKTKELNNEENKLEKSINSLKDCTRKIEYQIEKTSVVRSRSSIIMHCFIWFSWRECPAILTICGASFKLFIEKTIT